MMNKIIRLARRFELKIAQRAHVGESQLFLHNKITRTVTELLKSEPLNLDSNQYTGEIKFVPSQELNTGFLSLQHWLIKINLENKDLTQQVKQTLESNLQSLTNEDVIVVVE